MPWISTPNEQLESSRSDMYAAGVSKKVGLIVMSIRIVASLLIAIVFFIISYCTVTHKDNNIMMFGVLLTAYGNKYDFE